MGKKLYLGGSTVVGAFTRAKHIDNTRGEYFPPLEEEPQRDFPLRPEDQFRLVFERVDFGQLKVLFEALQHLAIHRDVRVLIRLAEAESDTGDSYLNLINLCLVSHRFERDGNRVAVKKNGRLRWSKEAVRSLYQAMARIARTDGKDLPVVQKSFQKLLL